MATWTTKEKWDYDEVCDGCAPGTVTWEYQTTADILMLIFSEEEISSWGGVIPARVFREYIGNSRALAMRQALNHWYERYHGNGHS